jgi:hypothetical protein
VKLFKEFLRIRGAKGDKTFMKLFYVGAVAIALTVGLFVGPVRAETRREEQMAKLEVRKGLLQDLREKIASKTDLLRSAAALRRAAIVRGEITAIADTTLTVEKDDTSYTVLTGAFDGCTTRFIRKYWGSSTIAELSVGDIVNVYGKWQDEAHTTIEACLIRDLSIQKRHAVFVGFVESLTASGWVMTTVGEKRPNQTVVVTADTKFVNRKEETILQSDILVDHRVRVKGLWNNDTNTVSEVTHVKDYTLPVIVEEPEE